VTAQAESLSPPGARRGFSLVPASADGRGNALVAALVFFFTLGVYGYCLYPTTPYWDSGEYIATSYILGIPHPPGTPLYVLIGRLFSMLPFASPAVLVNFLSAISSATAVLFTYLITVRLVRRNFADSGWLAWVGGVVAALFMAFGTTFWDNAVEAEVYASASAIMCFCVWLAFVWWDHQGEARNDRILWLILYVLFLAIGIHMGTFLVFPCIYLLVTMVHWDRVNKGAFWGSIGVFLVAAFIRTAVIVNANRIYNITELSMAPESMRLSDTLLTLVMAAAVAWNVVSVLGRRFALGIGVLAVLGVSVHLYLLIRAGLDPAINEADPYTWDALKLVLARDQYKPPEPIFRKADLWYQFDQMYLRYFSWQFHLAKIGNIPTYAFPILIGLFGGFLSFFRERKSFWLMATLLLITGPFLVYYLNFREGEVRERDYFFVANYHIFAIWIGLGVAGIARLMAGAFEHAVEGKALFRPAVAGVAAFGLFLSVLPLAAGQDNQNFYRHNRRGNWVAHGYAHNMLVGLEPNAIIFTNGDNDTFPLWYIQEVENFRKDVRVVNLSLLQTHWYIKQLRDYEPKVPVVLDDGQINALEPYRERDGRIVFVNDLMVKHIIEKNAWKRAVYFAVTVPDQRGMEAQMRMEGLVFRVYPEPQGSGIDTAKLRENLDSKYQYRGFLTSTGDYDLSVYKDEQATRLLQNYAAARVRLALGLHAEGKTEEARRELEKVQKYAKYFPGVDAALGASYAQIGLPGEAESYYARLLAEDPDNAGALSVLGHLKLQAGDTTEAIRLLTRAIEVNPAGDFNPYADMANIHQMRGELEPVLALLRQWLRYHPDDERVRGYVNALTGQAPAGGR
jgi:tetratricopeptide (TPR) repeat protein